MRYVKAEEPNPLFPAEFQHLRPACIEFSDGRIVEYRGLTEEAFNVMLDSAIGRFYDLGVPELRKHSIRPATSPNVPSIGSRDMGGDLR